MAFLMIKRLFRLVLLLALAIYLYCFPHSFCWLFVAGGWVIHTKFYSAAIHVFSRFASEDALRSRALVHTYMGECDKAIEIYETQVTPLRRQNYFNENLNIVEYRPGEAFDLANIYGYCAGHTEKAFNLTEDAKDRLTATLKFRHEKVVQAAQRSDIQMGLGELASHLYFQLAVAGWEFASGRYMKAVIPIGVTKLAIMPTHQEYLDLIDQNFPDFSLSDYPPPLFEHHWQSDTLWSASVGYEVAGYLYGALSSFYANTIFLAGSAWRAKSIHEKRSVRYTILTALDKAVSAKDPKVKLAWAERARLCTLDAPASPLGLMAGLGVVVLGEAIDAYVHLGRVDEVEKLVPLFLELWDAKQRAQQNSGFSDWYDGKVHKHISAKYAWETFVFSPAKAKWANRDITDKESYKDLLHERHELWTSMNLTTADTFDVSLWEGGDSRVQTQHDSEF